MNTITTRTLLALAMAATMPIALAGCSDTAPGEAPATNEATTPEPEPIAPVPVPVPIAPPAPEPVREEPTNTVEAPPPEKPITADAQMLDDADATGMTARLQRDADSAPADTEQGQ